MGIPGLWKIVQEVGHKMSIHHLSVETGFVQNAGGTHGLRLGVDALGWIFRACYRHSNTKNPELATLFARCIRLFQLPIFPLFVFDGAGRPKTKRNKVVRGSRLWIEKDFKLLLDAFGFAWIDAPAEAEAELAMLSRDGYLDAILSEDSDNIVFGAKAVLRIDESVDRDEQVILYQMADIEQCLSYTTADFILIALLVGGDYDAGIPGCGIEVASALARAGYGRSLVNGASLHTGPTLRAFLSSWRSSLVNELRTNQSRHLTRRCPAVARKIPSNFPSFEIFNLYVNPLTSSLPPPVLFSKTVNLPALARFAEDRFSWGDPIGICKQFSESVYPGIALRSLILTIQAWDIGLHQTYHGLVGNPISLRKPSTGSHHPRHHEVRVALNITKTLVEEILAGLKQTPQAQERKKIADWFADADILPKIRAWIPLAIFRAVFPEATLKLNGAGGSSV